MLQATLIGNVGADARLQEKDGHKFTTFRVAHNETWVDQSGQQHSNTMWVDCVLNDHPKVAQYLRQGQQVFLIGTVKTRVYSSAKERCMKAGLTINVLRVELLGGASDPVPSRLYDSDGIQHDVVKYYLTDAKNATLMTQRGAQFTTDANGWITSLQESTQVQQPTNTQTDAEPDRSSDNAPAFN